MSRTIVVDPVTRIEGHQEIITSVENGVVSSAKVRGTMARGFENFLVGRRWMDATIAVSRVCGVCWHVHAEAANKAFEKATATTPTTNGRLMRELTIATHLIADHILHTYFLTGPDWFNVIKAAGYSGNNKKVQAVIKAVKSNTFGLVNSYPAGKYIEDSGTCQALLAHYLDALEFIQKIHRAIAVCGSKAPHPHSITPAGVTTEITPEKLSQLAATLQDARSFVESTLLQDAIAIASYFPEHFELGNGGGNFLANPSCFYADGSSMFRAGVVVDGKHQSFSQSKVSEEVDKSYYDGSGNYDTDKKGAYSFVKAPRYAGRAMEVGPLARLVVNKDKRFADIVASLGGRVGSSNMCRLLARGIECLNLLEYSEEVIAYLAKHSNEPFIKAWNPNADYSGEGWGYGLAARGALMHYYKIEQGVIKKSDLIVPSTWNFSPSSGPAEQAMKGLPASWQGNETSLEIMRTTHSFDPCMACSIH